MAAIDEYTIGAGLEEAEKMPAKLTSRLAEVSDAPVIAIIYNEGIEDRVATFETELRTAEAIAEQLQARAATHPATVVERDGRVVGFAWTGEYRPRRAYAGVGEVSVYVARVARGQGVGLGESWNSLACWGAQLCVVRPKKSRTGPFERVLACPRSKRWTASFFLGGGT